MALEGNKCFYVFQLSEVNAIVLIFKTDTEVSLFVDNSTDDSFYIIIQGRSQPIYLPLLNLKLGMFSSL